ncbi:aprataxin [Onthophagus taurus]|uniref:aprataxin n=1 Tax=Onthophagus taurus TaxID=166361 RepID=UPI000C206135|nr:aprataxin [Onthophagus taurus]
MSGKRKRVVGEDSDNGKKVKSNGHWQNGLLSAMEDPELIVQSNPKLVVIKDKFPKAEFHYLIIPREDINSLKAVDQSHAGLLKYMHNIAQQLVDEPRHKSRCFKMGYHAEASMARLHMHVISDDMNSPCLKTKKHWNSFTTEFLMDSKLILEDVEKHGKVKVFSTEYCKRLMDTPLKCHKCDFVPKTMPDLKKHIVKHITK